MIRILISASILSLNFFLTAFSLGIESEDDIYKKIDLFSEVLEKINKKRGYRGFRHF